MDMFARALAPISAEAFGQIDEQAIATLRANLSARKFVDVKGPFGWGRSCVYEGRMGKFQKEGEVGFGMRECVRLVESRVDFELDIMELHGIERGCDDPDLVPVEQAAKKAAAFEEKIVYEGLAAAGMKGLAGSSELKAIDLPTGDPEAFVRAITDAVDAMAVEESIQGPYALVGGKKLRDALCKLVSGRTLCEVVEKATDVDEFIYTPSYDGAFLVSKRGGDLELTLGGDFTIGYTGRNGDHLKFFIAESLAFRIIEPRAFASINLK